MQIARGVAMLEITAAIMGRPTTVCPTVLWEGERALLVDTGYPGQHLLIQEALKQEGVPVQYLQTILFTHQDIDHIGSAPGLLSQVPHPVEILSHPLEKPYIEGERPLVKFTPQMIERVVAALPHEWPAERRAAFKHALENPPHVRVDRTVVEGEELPFCGGIVVVGTPGHTPGHICLYHKPSRTLVAGDALAITDKGLGIVEATTSLDPPLAAQAARKLTAFDIAQVICFHGGLYDRDANKRVAELAAESGQ